MHHEDKEKLAELHKAAEAAVGAENGNTLFQYIKPQPKDLFTGDLGSKEREYCIAQRIPNWYDWNIENWGTKWAESELYVGIGKALLQEGELTEKENVLKLSFRTAWSPPEPVMDALVDDGFHVEMIYMEQGMDYWGWYINGVTEWSGEVFSHYVDSYGNTYAQWDELPTGAEGKGELKTIHVEGTGSNPDWTYTMHEIEWEHDPERSKKKALDAGLPEFVWDRCNLGEPRGG